LPIRTAIGNGASTSAVNQVSIGTASNTYRMPGHHLGGKPRGAIRADLVRHHRPNGNLAAANFSPADISTLQTNVSILQGRRRRLCRRR
jgi:hypothetical protein